MEGEELTKELAGMYAKPMDTDSNMVKAWDRRQVQARRGPMGKGDGGIPIIFSTIKIIF